MRPPALASAPINAHGLYHLVTPHERRRNFLCRNDSCARIMRGLCTDARFYACMDIIIITIFLYP